MPAKSTAHRYIIGLVVVAVLVLVSTNLPADFLSGNVGKGEVKEICRCDCTSLSGETYFSDSSCTDKSWDYNVTPPVDCSAYNGKTCKGFYQNSEGECRPANNEGNTQYCKLVTVPVQR